jgi:hypothetical protein
MSTSTASRSTNSGHFDAAVRQVDGSMFARLDLLLGSLWSPGLTLGVRGFNQRLSAVSSIQQPQAHVSW